MIVKNALAATATTNLQDAINKADFFKYTNIGQMVENVITVSLSISAILVLLFIIWGAIDLISSQGDKQQYEGARNKITYAIVGLAIVALAWASWIIILKFFGIGTIGLDSGSVILPNPDNSSTSTCQTFGEECGKDHGNCCTGIGISCKNINPAKGVGRCLH